jgi:hypothetical protein
MELVARAVRARRVARARARKVASTEKEARVAENSTTMDVLPARRARRVVATAVVATAVVATAVVATPRAARKAAREAKAARRVAARRAARRAEY